MASRFVDPPTEVLCSVPARSLSSDAERARIVGYPLYLHTTTVDMPAMRTVDDTLLLPGSLQSLFRSPQSPADIYMSAISALTSALFDMSADESSSVAAFPADPVNGAPKLLAPPSHLCAVLPAPRASVDAVHDVAMHIINNSPEPVQFSNAHSAWLNALSHPVLAANGATATYLSGRAISPRSANLTSWLLSHIPPTSPLQGDDVRQYTDRGFPDPNLLHKLSPVDLANHIVDKRTALDALAFNLSYIRDAQPTTEMLTADPQVQGITYELEPDAPTPPRHYLPFPQLPYFLSAYCTVYTMSTTMQSRLAMTLHFVDRRRDISHFLRDWCGSIYTQAGEEDNRLVLDPMPSLIHAWQYGVASSIIESMLNPRGVALLASFFGVPYEKAVFPANPVKHISTFPPFGTPEQFIEFAKENHYD